VLWGLPTSAPDAAAWRPLLSTLEHMSGSVAQLGPADATLASPLPGQLDGCISLADAAARLRMHLAGAAAAAPDSQLALQLLDGLASALPQPESSAPSLSAAGPPLQLLTELQAAAVLAQLPSTAGARTAGLDDPLQGSGRAPAHAARLSQLLDDLVPQSSSTSIAGCRLGFVDSLLQGSGGDAALQPAVLGMPAAVRGAAARGCLLLACWAQVTSQISCDAY
jgi:hypothetical protein